MAALALAGTIGALMLVPCCLRPLRGPAARFYAAPTTRRIAARMAANLSNQSSSRRQGAYIQSIDEAAGALRAGRLVAFPTETVYGLGAHAFDNDAVASIFTVKGRPRSDPLIVHVSSAEAAEELVRLDDAGLAVMRELMESFWPGPLTLVAPACPELPPAVTAGTGFVGVRCPDHARAVELLKAAAVPVAAPSANRFGHVSPTRPEHVMDDLGDHDIFVLLPAEETEEDVAARIVDADAAAICCDVGIESTVLKVDADGQELVLLRRGGVPEAALKRWLDGAQSQYGLRVQPPKLAAPPPLTPAAVDQQDAPVEGGQEAPGMSLTHYAPDLPSFLLAASAPPPTSRPARSPSASRRGSAQRPLSFPISSAIVLDYGARLAHLQSTVHAYRDLSPAADACEAAAGVFEALRWAEGHASQGGRCVLLPDVDEPAPPPRAKTRGARNVAGAAEHAPALSDRLYRAASGRSARLAKDGERLVVLDGEDSA